MVQMKYPRNMLGYAGKPPNPKWPKEAKIAVQFVLNYEEGGENCVLHGDEMSEAFLSEIVGASNWPNKRHWNMESMYEYGARAGFWRIHKIFSKNKIPLTVYAVASAIARSPEQVQAMQDAEWEIACHGLKWKDYKDVSADQELKDMKTAIKIHEIVTGSKPQGWYLGRCSTNTVQIATDFGDFDYLSDAYDDDLPYWFKSKNKNQLIIPYTLDANDMRFATTQGFNSGTQFFEYLKDTFDCLRSEGLSGEPKMMSIGLHCRLVGRPGRAAALEKFLDYIGSFPDVWIAKRIEIANHWREKHAANSPKICPYDMTRSEFLKSFGNIFENSEWIAERAFNFEVSPAMNSTHSLFAALRYQFRKASRREKMRVILEHPDLAGKLAQSNKLGHESKVEQKSAGLSNLTVEELKKFKDLNKKYSRKFKHPFIMAVKNVSKQQILRNFEQRISNQVESEFQTACSEIEKIALLRVKEIMGD